MIQSLPTVDDCIYYTSRDEMPADAVQQLEDLAYRWGETYDAYLVNEGKREYFWLPRREGVVGFSRRGRCALVVGGLLAPPEKRKALLEALLEFAKSKRWNLSFYNIGRSETAVYKEAGCEITKMGEEPIIDLERTEWRGKKYEWVRRQENYCKRQGVELVEVRTEDDNYEQEIAPQLEQVSQLHVADTLHAREMKFFVGSFDPHHLGSRRLFVAWHEGRVVAFIVCNPCVAGEMWAIEIYRKLPDAPRGVVPFAIMSILRTLKEEGVKFASLSLIPLLRCNTDPKEKKIHHGSRVFYFIARFWWNRMNWVFDMRGIYHFKSRFRPDYREMYLAAFPKVTIRSMWALGMTWEVLKFNPLRLLRRGQGGGKQRDTLAKPAQRPERVVRDVRNKRSKQKAAAEQPAANSEGQAPLPGDAAHAKPGGPHLDHARQRGADADNGDGQSAEAASK